MGKQKLYGLIGLPLGHSFSKQFFTEKFEREGLTDCRFELFPLPSIEAFPALLKENPSLKGIAVTIPYKEKVLQYVHSQSVEVLQTGATNSIKISNGFLTACNTDITGFEKTFMPLLQPHHYSGALVLGTGGAAKAVQFVLGQLGIPFIMVSRTPSGANTIGYGTITRELLEEYPVIINCTPAGMYPDETGCPDIPYQYLSRRHYLYDLVYRPAETVFLRRGKEKGATVKNGYDMLEIQALASWDIWNRD